MEFNYDEMSRKCFAAIQDPIEPKYKKYWRQIPTKSNANLHFSLIHKDQPMQKIDEMYKSKYKHADKNSKYFQEPNKEKAFPVSTQKNFYDNMYLKQLFIPNYRKPFSQIKSANGAKSSISITKRPATANAQCQTDPIFEPLTNPYGKKKSQLQMHIDSIFGDSDDE